MPIARPSSQSQSFIFHAPTNRCFVSFFFIFVFDLFFGSRLLLTLNFGRKKRRPRGVGIRRARIKIYPRNEHAATSRFPFRPRNTRPRCRELPTPGRFKLLSRHFYSAILATFQRRTFSHSWPNRRGPFSRGKH